MGIRTFPSNPTLFGGTGKDGAFAPSVSENFTDAEGSWVIKEYSSINIPNGVTISADNRVKGLILYCSGNVVIDGEIDLDGKGYGSEQAPPIVFDRHYSSGVLKSAWAEYCAAVRGGDGGGGGGKSDTNPGGNGAHAGGSGGNAGGSGGNASGWTPGRLNYNGDRLLQGGALLTAIYSVTNVDTTQGGGAAYIGVQNCGGNAGTGGTTTSGGAALIASATFATLTTGAAYGGALLVIIAKGSITLGSTANIHCDGSDGTALNSVNGCDGAAGGGCIVLLSEAAQSIDVAATQTVAGGTGGVNAGAGGGGGNGDAGTIVNQAVA